MIISLNVLSQYVDLKNLSVEEIQNKLTFSGLEVEGVEFLASGTNLVIGQILEVKEHPNSDHLHVLKVDEGSFGIHQIVCGASNVKVGLKVIVAREGAKLPNNVVIKKSVIRNVESDGMCCSLLELGVNKALLNEKQCAGIEELENDAPVGETEVLKYLGLDDVLLDINVLANRSDILSIYSLAKEVGALFHRKVSIPSYTIPSDKKTDFSVSSLTNGCPQFAFRVIKNIRVKESPEWLKRVLRSEGIRSLNNVVDIGNYVMLLTGRPVHMYDLDKIGGKQIVVKDDYKGPFVALDEKTYDLIPSDLVVSDGKNPLCLGGIMGSLSCAVDENTKNVGIECATFLSHLIRHTSSRLGLSSDSSARFVKGIHPCNEKEVIHLLSYLLKELAEGKEFEEPIYYDARKKEEVLIPCSYSYINERLGTAFNKEEMKEVFDAFEIRIEEKDEDQFLAYPPKQRIDLRCDADLSEEIFRTIGLEKIHATLPISQITLGGQKDHQKKKRILREYLVDKGLVEILTYTLISNAEDQKYFTLNRDEPWKVLNPMTVDHQVVRRGLLASVLNVLRYNKAHQMEDLAIFETSLIETKASSYDELCIALSGKKYLRGNLETKKYDYYSIAGLLYGILDLFGIKEGRYRLEKLTDPSFHPGRSVQILLGEECIGVCGQLHPRLLEEEDLSEVYILDLNLSALMNVRISPLKMSAISKYPSIYRDYALVAKKNVSGKMLLDGIKKISPLVTDASIFDIYEGENIGPDVRSIAIRVTYSCFEKTLKDEEINVVEEKMFKIFETLGCTLRK